MFSSLLKSLFQHVVKSICLVISVLKIIGRFILVLVSSSGVRRILFRGGGNENGDPDLGVSATGAKGRGVRGAKPPGRWKFFKNINKNIKKYQFLTIFEEKNNHFLSRKL